MTNVTFYKDKNKTKIIVSGHSNASRINGADLCCCSVSTLVFTMMKSLCLLSPDNLKYSYGDGWCCASYTNSDAPHDKASVVVETILNGFKLLQDSYPENVKINLKKGQET